MKTTQNINYLVQTFTKSLLCSNHSMDYHLDVWQTAHNFAKGLEIQGLAFEPETIECIVEAIAYEGVNYRHSTEYDELRRQAAEWCAENLVGVLAEQVDVWQDRIKIAKAVVAARKDSNRRWLAI